MWSWFVLAAALLIAVLIVVDALRHPILGRMAVRNAWRRPRQTATVIAGLMVGTAIISASLVAGASATSAIREAVFENLGPADETVRTDGFYFFPQVIAEDLIASPRLQDATDGATPFIFWDGAAEHPNGLFEPSVSLIGYDLERDAAFGDFTLVGGGRTDGSNLPSGSAIATKALAEELELEVGDTITLATTLPADPLLPAFDLNGGVLIGTTPGLLGLGPAGPATATHTFDVPVGSKQVTAILVCGEDGQCPPGTSLRLDITAPDGTTQGSAHVVTPATDCTTCAPPAIWINFTTGPAEVLPAGTWTATVSGQVALQAPYGLVTVSLRPVYDLDELAERAAALEDEAAEIFGDDLDLDFFGERVETDVRIVAITDGGRGSFFDVQAGIFLPLDDLQSLLAREDEVNFVKFSNRGDTETGVRHTDDVSQRINATLIDLSAAYPGLTVVEHLQVNPVKQTFLQLADDAGELMTSLLIFAGSLTIITGLLLIINIFTMLAEERRSELGMARAVGLQRSDLIRLFLFEGSLYAVAAAAIGAVLGLGLAYALIALLNDILSRLDAAFPPIPFAVPAWAIPTAMAAGLLLTFITIAIASTRQSRLNIVRAIRLIDEPETAPRRAWLGWPLIAIGVALTATGWVILPLQEDGSFAGFPAFSLTVFGPLVTIIGIGMLLRTRFRRSRVNTSLALVLASYYVTTIFAITKYPQIEEANIVGPLRGVFLTLAIVMAVSYWRAGPKYVGRFLARWRRYRAVAAPAVSYPQHKRFRTGMTLAMFSIVILSIGFFSIFGALFDLPAERQTGGFDIEASTTLDVPDLAPFDQGLVTGIESQHRLLDQFHFDPAFITVSGERTGQFGPPGHHIYGVDQSFIEAQEFRLLWTLDDLSEQATYQRLLDEPGTVIVSYPYSTDERNQDLSHEVGELLHLHLGDCTIAEGTCPEYTIIGIQEQYHHTGIFLPQDEVERLFPQASALYLFKLDDPDKATQTAKDLERNYREIGMDADSSRVLVEKEQEGFRQILSAMKLFLGLGLIVGVLSLGIVTSRSVLERRQEIGMLRALGFTSRQVQRIFLIEVSMVIGMGFIIGLICSIIVTYGLWFAVIRELQYPYVIPWLEIVYLFLAAYVVAILATLAPIVRVGRVAPAEALRYLE